MAQQRRVAWTPEAQRTLDEALAFIAQDSEPAVPRVLDASLSAAKSLAILPERGRIVPEFASRT